MKTKIFLVLLILALGAGEGQAQNRNLRYNKGETLIGISGRYEKSFGAALSVTQLESWLAYGAEVYFQSNGCAGLKASFGPKFGDNFYISPALEVGLVTVREESLFSNGSDSLLYRRPAPRFAVGGQLRLGYNFGAIGIFAAGSYNRVFGYKQTNLSEEWVCTRRTAPKDLWAIQLGLAVSLDSDRLLSGDNCPELKIGGGYSSMGAFATVEVMSFDRFAFAVGHTYGGFANFYMETGNAEVGGKYNLEVYPAGSSSVYHFSVGAEAAIGQYMRPWVGVTTEEIQRFFTKWGVYSFGGRIAGIITPVALQLGVLNLSAYGSIGVAGQTHVTGTGDLGYQAQGSGAQLYWACGAKIGIAL